MTLTTEITNEHTTQQSVAEDKTAKRSRSPRELASMLTELHKHGSGNSLRSITHSTTSSTSSLNSPRALSVSSAEGEHKLPPLKNLLSQYGMDMPQLWLPMHGGNGHTQRVDAMTTESHSNTNQRQQFEELVQAVRGVELQQQQKLLQAQLAALQRTQGTGRFERQLDMVQNQNSNRMISNSSNNSNSNSNRRYGSGSGYEAYTSQVPLTLKSPVDEQAGERQSKRMAASNRRVYEKELRLNTKPNKTGNRKRGKKPASKKRKRLRGSAKISSVCIQCGTTETPEWRTSDAGPNTLCNACGLRWAKRRKESHEDY